MSCLFGLLCDGEFFSKNLVMIYFQLKNLVLERETCRRLDKTFKNFKFPRISTNNFAYIVQYISILFFYKQGIFVMYYISEVRISHEYEHTERECSHLSRGEAQIGNTRAFGIMEFVAKTSYLTHDGFGNTDL